MYNTLKDRTLSYMYLPKLFTEIIHIFFFFSVSKQMENYEKLLSNVNELEGSRYQRLPQMYNNK